jgi:proteasome lid subunit RPN8/RPN11
MSPDNESLLEEELARLQELFEVAPAGEENWKVHIALLPRVDIIVDFRKYPRRPSIEIPRELARICGKPGDFLLSLTKWNNAKPFHVASVVEELRNFIENVAGIKLRMLYRLATGLCEQARQYHPREFVGLLRVQGGVLAEYLLPPNMQSSAISAVYSGHNLPTDRSIIASVHSHPSGNASPSAPDLHMFSGGTQFFHVIIGFPYNFASMLAYDRRGKPIPIEIVASTPFDQTGEEEEAFG